jgi:hypothetical protein
MSAAANGGSSFRGWIQSTGQTSTHAVSFTPMHGSQMIYATTLILLAAAAVPAHGQPPEYTCDPELTRLFSPGQPSLGRYEVCTTAEPIPENRGEALEALDAFGAAGTYRRSALARLYGGRRVRVERRWAESAGRFVSVTRLSPHPDASLSRLISGTLEIRFTISRVGQVGHDPLTSKPHPTNLPDSRDLPRLIISP